MVATLFFSAHAAAFVAALAALDSNDAAGAAVGLFPIIAAVSFSNAAVVVFIRASTCLVCWSVSTATNSPVVFQCLQQCCLLMHAQLLVPWLHPAG